jgi:molybdopterin converting factor small subunit
MRVQVKLFANLARYAPDGVKAGMAFEVKVPGEATVADLLAKVNMLPREAKVIFINGRARQPETELADGDQVGIFPPIGGG